MRLTRIQPQVTQSPESGELDLSKYEESAIMVTGNNHGDWIYSSEVIDQTTLIVSQLNDASANPIKIANALAELPDMEYAEPKLVNRFENFSSRPIRSLLGNGTCTAALA